ncbi:MAG TPA: AMP-binding protein [Pusillimonas sp.]|uniref:AMP-binding protein n=1 Tax=Pusillimonas sp. TaxID=3040095 RepID=UPI002B53F6E4|nr:AMP-binding protein [Pusillimonas sp.]HUH87670.1 AMP-binding protein [Pusillimonas sp.]
MITTPQAPVAQAAKRSSAPFRPVRFAPVDINIQHRPDGTQVVSNRLPLAALPVRQLGDYLRRHAAQRPDQVFLAEPAEDGGWVRITYAQARSRVDALSQWLLDLGLPHNRPIMVLSENSIHHGLLQLAAMQIGIPVMPVSTAYSLMSRTCSKVGDLVSRFQPTLVYASDPVSYGNALRLAKSLGDALLVADQPAEGLIDTTLATGFQTTPTAQLEARYERIGLDDTARLLLTSGSTGNPKAVIMTQRNIITSGVLWDQVWPFLADQPLTLLDWLPWNHTAGAHGAFSMALRHGGALYIDDGKPVPQLIGRTVAHLREIKPNVMTNVPRGLDVLVAAIEADPSIADDIFPNLEVIVYGGAALSSDTLHKLEHFSAQATGQRIPVSASLGSTETTMPATLIWWPPHTLGTLGLPAPGVEAKLVPEGDRFEVRFRGANITPGYHLDPKANQEAFDEEGFLKTGDAVTWADADRPEHGLVYAGRLAENFKLSSGTWVSVANVRGELLEYLRPCIADVVLAAPNQHELGAMLFIDFNRVRKQFAECAEMSNADICRHAPLKTLIEQGVQQYNARFPGSSTRIARAILLDSPPDVDTGEITDKGHINQRGVLKLREPAMQRLYCAGPQDLDCLVFETQRSA